MQMWALVGILLLGFVLRVALLTADRFHADEALYAGWALLIPGQDPLLLGVPVDKPPLFLYSLAGSLLAFGRSELAARLPSLAASMASIALVYRLARRLYGQATGIWAALLMALSPFDILFARTAFTDSMLVMWSLAALCTVAGGHWFGAGLLLGLAFATKQHALFVVPLVLAVGWIQTTTEKGRPAAQHRLRGLLPGLLGFALPLAAVVAWDSARWAIRPSYWQQSAMSYGGLAWAPIAKWGARWAEWWSWARYLGGSPVLGILLLLGCTALLALGWLYRPRARETWLDTLWVAFALAYLAAHSLLQFSIWDRYLLPLAPLVALLLARTLVALGSIRPLLRHPFPQSNEQRQARPGGARWARHSRTRRSMLAERFPALDAALIALILFVALFSGWQAAHNAYPIGGEHWAYQGLDEVTTYLKAHAPPDAVVYHHWLRWHYSYYLYDTEYELRWWESGEHLGREAHRSPDRAQYIVLPDWHTLQPSADGIRFEPLYETQRKDGSISLRLYQVVLEQLASQVAPVESETE